jgi:DNA-binding LacI/PurR family transcriptional regulator/ABC-type glycerol-3-phosphate transport system substrate-binding protein
MATIKDVARKAGVSISTVSNILNNKAKIKQETYDRVMKAVDELHYTPNLLASNLKSQKHHFIALILPDTGYNYSHIIKAVHRVVSEQGYFLLIKITDYNDRIQQEKLEQVLQANVRGVLISTVSNGHGQFETFSKRKIPLVFLYDYVSSGDFASVTFNNQTQIYEQTIKLLKRTNGCIDSKRDLVLILGDRSYASEYDCELGFKRAHQETGLTGDVYEVGIRQEIAMPNLLHLINNMEDLPKAFIVSREEIAECLIEVLTMLEITTPIFVLAGTGDWFNFNRDANYTTLQRNSLLLGETAAKMLLEFIHNPMLFEKRQVVIKNRSEEELLKSGSWKGRTNVSLLGMDGVTLQAVEKLMPAFEKEYNIKIDIEKLDIISLHERIQKTHQLKDGSIDLFMIDYAWLNHFENEEYLHPLNIYAQHDPGLIDGFLDVVKTLRLGLETKLYAIPLHITTQLLAYRRDLFENRDYNNAFRKEYGIDLRVPRTWREYELVARFFTRAYNPHSPVLYATHWNGLDNVSIADEFYPRQWSFRGKMMQNNRVAFNSNENLRAISNMKNIFQYAEPIESSNTRYNEWERILHGDVATTIIFATHIPHPSSTHKNTLIDYNKIQYSNVPGNTPLLGGWWLGINRFSNHIEESYTFLRWITSSKVAVHNTLLGGFVPRHVVANNSYLLYYYPWLKYMPQNMRAARDRQCIHTKKGEMIDSIITDSVLSGELRSVLLGNSTEDEALVRLQQQFEQMTDL